MVARLRGRRPAAAEKRERLRKSRRRWWSDTANDPGVSDLERAAIQKAVREAEVRNDAIAKRLRRIRPTGVASTPRSASEENRQRGAKSRRADGLDPFHAPQRT